MNLTNRIWFTANGKKMLHFEIIQSIQQIINMYQYMNLKIQNTCKSLIYKSEVLQCAKFYIGL